jgi:hypothetical protein
MVSRVVLNSKHFYVSIQEGPLTVVLIPLLYIPNCAWYVSIVYFQFFYLVNSNKYRWLIREIEKICTPPNESNQSDNTVLFNSFIVDNDGLSLVTKPSCLPILQSLIAPDQFTVSPQLWRALAINVTGPAYELPGAVYYLADILSGAGFSIFHISTYESEVFLIQEQDIDRACKILQDSGSSDKVNQFLERSMRLSSEAAPPLVLSPNSTSTASNNKSSTNSSYNLNDLRQAAKESSYLYEEENGYVEEGDHVNLDVSWISPANTKTIFHPQSHSPVTAVSNSQVKKPIASCKDAFYLMVLPNHVILARLNGPSSAALKIMVMIMLLN